MHKLIRIAAISILLVMTLVSSAQTYFMPAESTPHEGTWLQWPHQYEYGTAYRNSLDATWVEMTSALVGGEKVHIIAYNATEQSRITDLLNVAGVNLTNVDFQIIPTNDVWVRDNGPIFVLDSAGNLIIENWGFNGWGGDAGYNHCNLIPASLGSELSIPMVDLNSLMVVEGGAFEIDGNGVFMATKSSILTQTNSGSSLAIRNVGMTQTQAEAIFTQYLGVDKFIWLDGYLSDEDITDAHIDGFAKFADDSTLVTMDNADLLYWGLSAADIATLYSASDVNGETYNKVYIPLTQNDVITTFGNNLGYKGSYCNYYLANNAVLVPNYNDPNDVVANSIIQSIHTDKIVVGIDCRNLYENGGMVHCVTQQQPVAPINANLNDKIIEVLKVEQNFPNPFNHTTVISFSLVINAEVKIDVYNSLGQLALPTVKSNYTSGKHSVTMDADKLKNGIYTYVITIDNGYSVKGRMVINK